MMRKSQFAIYLHGFYRKEREMYVIIVCFVAGFLVYFFLYQRLFQSLSFLFFSQVHVVSGSAAAFEPSRFGFVDLVRSRKVQ